MDQTRLQEQLAKVKAELAELRTPSTMVFPLFSDLHTRGPEGAAALDFLPVLQTLCRELNADAVINLGDNLNTMGRTLHIGNVELATMLNTLFEQMQKASKLPMFLINGNHDGVGTDFFKVDFWNALVKGKYDGGLARYDEAGSYFYVDYPKTRLVFLSLPSDSMLNQEFPSPVWAFGEKQLNWLEQVALDTDSQVLLFCHVPFYDNVYRDDPEETMTVWDGEKRVVARVACLCGWIEDIDRVAEIVENSGKVAICFGGHTHYDAIFEPHEKKGQEENPLPCRQVVTTCAIPWKCPEGDLGIAVDILLWNPEEVSVHLLRFGDGESRHHLL